MLDGIAKAEGFTTPVYLRSAEADFEVEFTVNKGMTEAYDLGKVSISYPSTHSLGPNRTPEKARDGVVNKWGQTHDIENLFISDGLQFTTGAVENPTLTIVSLAIRQAHYMAEQLGSGAL